MSFLQTPTKSPPQSPKRLCEINYTTIAEDAENLQMSPDAKKRSTAIRLHWLQLISSVQKMQQMQKTFHFLRYVNIDAQLRQFRMKLALRKWHTHLMKLYWRRFNSGLIHDNYMVKFEERAKRVLEVRAKQAADYLKVHPSVEPDFEQLLKATTAEPVENLQGKYLNRNREEREFEDAERERLERERLRRLQEEEEEEEEVIEREVLPEPEPVPRFSRKWIITFTVGAIIGLIIGLIWFMKSNSRLIRYLREERHQPPQEFNPADSPFGKLNGPKQGEAVGNEVQPDEVPGAANNE